MACPWHHYVIGAIFVVSQASHSSGHYSSRDSAGNDEEHEQPGGPSKHHPISDHRFFLHEIFNKYGHDGQMTFEGFEHLLESLGLGNIIIPDHDLYAHKEEQFLTLHDTHDHSKKDDHTTSGRTVTTAPPGTQKSTASQFPIATSTIPTSTTQSSISRFTHRNNRNSLPTTHSDVTRTVGHNINHTAVASENIYHYSLRDVKIPDMLVNISTMVDNHNGVNADQPDVIIEQCLSPKEILGAFGINQTSSLNASSFLHLCPAIIYELDQGHCLFRDRSHHRKSKSIASVDQWIYSSVAVLLISLCGLVSVAAIPLMQKWFYHTLLQFFVGLAVGSLSGDGLLHLMPHAMLGGEGSHDHSDPMSAALSTEKMAVWRGFTALGGIFFFFMAERLLGNWAAYRKKNKELLKVSKDPDPFHPVDNSHHGSIGEKLSQYRKSTYDFETSEKEMINMLNAETFSSRKGSVESLTGLESSYPKRPTFSLGPPGISAPSPPGDCAAVELPEKSGHGHGHSHEVPDSVSAVAWMVIMGDGLHNFCDGLAIGAAFASGLEGGISTTVAVFCHELPHELGDFAMLLKTGMKVKQALFYNVISSVLCFLGMIIGVSLGNVNSATSWVFAATAGMFLYIALVDMLPELSVVSEDPDTTVSYQLAVQVLGICCGVSIMLVIANYEQDLQNLVS